jgi:hypothetical protein
MPEAIGVRVLPYCPSTSQADAYCVSAPGSYTASLTAVRLTEVFILRPVRVTFCAEAVLLKTDDILIGPLCNMGVTVDQKIRLEGYGTNTDLKL